MAKPRIEVLAMADQVIEAKDNKKSLIGIFNKIFVRKLPAVHSRMSLFVTLIGDDGAKDALTILVKSPSGKELSKTDIQYSYGTNGKADIILNLERFPIEEHGDYEFIVQHDGKKLGTYVVQSVQVKETDTTSSVVN